MIPQARLINYARNFLDSEIEKIEELLKHNNMDSMSEDLLRKLLNEYKHDLEVIERECV
jgi:hypothetical protein